ncbi:MAG: hypothetical protein WA790_02515 [Sulfitobacter sp.]
MRPATFAVSYLDAGFGHKPLDPCNTARADDGEVTMWQAYRGIHGISVLAGAVGNSKDICLYISGFDDFAEITKATAKNTIG